METFFKPWHAARYSGFTACATWIAWLVFQQARACRRGLDAIPIGYEWGMAGAFIFGLGGFGDMIWHTVFGIEVGTNALFSPTHLMLLTPRPERVVAVVVPLLIWGLYFAGIAWLGGGIGLNREFWTGISVMAGLSGLLLSLLVTPMHLDKPRSLEG